MFNGADSFVDLMVVVGDVLTLDFLNKEGKGRPVTCCIVTKYESIYPVALLALNLGTGWRWVWVVNVSPRLIYLLGGTKFLIFLCTINILGRRTHPNMKK